MTKVITPEKASQLLGETIVRPSGDLTPEIIQQLMLPFDWHADIEYKPGEVNARGDTPTALALCYISADKAIQRLNGILGGLWAMPEPKLLRDNEKGAGFLVGMNLCGTERWNAGEADRSEKEPLKSALTDGIKRTARLFGVGWYFTLLSHQLWIPCEVDKDGKFKCWKDFLNRDKGWGNPADYFKQAYPLIRPDRAIDEEALQARHVYTRSGKEFVPAQNPPAVIKSTPPPNRRPQIPTGVKPIPDGMFKELVQHMDRTGVNDGTVSVPPEFVAILTKPPELWRKEWTQDRGAKALDWLQTLPNKKKP